ncbi:MAG: hypothetical protein LBL35_02415 [Clostridiales bacterium]|nr:hypothetical protein [Clostridiales bacterium]
MEKNDYECESANRSMGAFAKYSVAAAKNSRLWRRIVTILRKMSENPNASIPPAAYRRQ